MRRRRTVYALTTAEQVAALPVMLERLATMLRRAADAKRSIEGEALDDLVLAVDALYEYAAEAARLAVRFSIPTGFEDGPKPPRLDLVVGGRTDG